MKRLLILTVVFCSLQSILFSQAILIGDTTSEHIYYQRLDKQIPTALESSSQFNLDLNKDGVDDVKFQLNHTSSSSINDIKFLVIPISEVYFSFYDSVLYDTLGLGVTIDGNLNWNTDLKNALVYHRNQDQIPIQFGGKGTYSSGVGKEKDAFYPFKFVTGDTIAYGWFRINLISEYIVSSYAIQKLYNLSGVNAKFKNRLSVYPNPVVNDVFVELPNTLNTSGSFSIYTSLGRLVKEGQLNNSSQNVTIPVQNLEKGTYLLKIQTTDKVFTSSFVKEYN
jgi:hypothetical protein